MTNEWPRPMFKYPEEAEVYVRQIMEAHKDGDHSLAHRMEETGYKHFVYLIASGEYDPEEIQETAGKLLLAGALNFERKY